MWCSKNVSFTFSYPVFPRVSLLWTLVASVTMFFARGVTPSFPVGCNKPVDPFTTISVVPPAAVPWIHVLTNTKIYEVECHSQWRTTLIWYSTHAIKYQSEGLKQKQPKIKRKSPFITNTGSWNAMASMVILPKHSPRACKEEKEYYETTSPSLRHLYLYGLLVTMLAYKLMLVNWKQLKQVQRQ